ncbi:MAG: hypothetical protein WCJ35_09775 [Planctomycetota bacterium]
MKLDKYFLNLAGEYRVCSEVLKRGVFATITYGNMKGADILVVGKNRKAAVIEVKASNSCRFVTGFYQKYKTPDQDYPNFWVLYSVCEQNGEFIERFFVLTHAEMAKAQAQRNHPKKTLDYAERVKRAARGVDNVILKDVDRYESRWDRILQYCNDPI